MVSGTTTAIGASRYTASTYAILVSGDWPWGSAPGRAGGRTLRVSDIWSTTETLPILVIVSRRTSAR